MLQGRPEVEDGALPAAEILERHPVQAASAQLFAAAVAAAAVRPLVSSGRVWGAPGEGLLPGCVDAVCGPLFFISCLSYRMPYVNLPWLTSAAPSVFFGARNTASALPGAVALASC